MNPVLDPIDIGALRTLVMVYDLGSFSAAAHRLEVNQSTISHTVERLRKAFQDSLFVRQGNGIAATERCDGLAQWARGMIEEIEGLAAPAEFDPVAAGGSVTISCNHHERQTVMPVFVARLRKAAPKVKLALIEAGGHGDMQLRQNMCDIVIGPVGIAADNHYRRSMLSDEYVCVMDANHSLARGRISLSAYAKAEHIFVTYGGEWQPLYVDVLKARGIGLQPSITLPTHDCLERLLPGSTLIASIPRKLALTFREGLHVAPFPVRVPISIDMYWNARTARSGLHKWMRDLLVEVASASTG
ncbi:LysR family transcriptional regulator [Bradyrhizobium sp. KB893862 SZCCT0404]|uniref:LysR family transcriptional regulator n=1 Tax=Bradyrhizobium sp. KB893862 SZCCT0404 TaxID=2807672 RepID=UPI001BAB38CC|nr:LysR family transcriptional regulator [Bradyrhizobium sp. KB893862 SZCCT0404]MBR1175270.1 LysR family transcriptional regulator [Bradyrhizobium sp. KB893862 SZCCT0404]